jgi:hypothetical protein
MKTKTLRSIAHNVVLKSIGKLKKKMLGFFVLSIGVLPYDNLSAQTIAIDGNPADWPAVLASSSVPFKTRVADAVNSSSDNVWTIGSQNVDPIANWGHTLSNTNDKTDLGNSGLALIGHKLYFFADLFDANGDAAIGFWVLKDRATMLPGGHFDGVHMDGDLLISVLFTNGHTTATPTVYKWLGGALVLAPMDSTAESAATNGAVLAAPSDWAYTSKFGVPGTYPATTFFEGFIDLDSVGITFDPCFTSFLTLTWNSHSPTASLADLIGGNYIVKPQVSISDQAVCSGAPATFTAIATGAAPFQYSWNGGAFAASGTLTIDPTIVSEIETVVVKDANGCTSKIDSAQLTVTATPNVNAVASAAYCSGDVAPAISFSGAVPGATFSWASSANVGFGLSGTGSIASFTATNTSTVAVTATVTVTPSGGGCTGADNSFTITVNPVPTISGISNYVYCSGDAGSGINFLNFSNFVVGSVFSWVATSNIGFGTSGTGNIAPFTAINTGTAPIVTTITVTPSAGGCTGTPFSFTITINPMPDVNPVGNRFHCSGDAAAAIPFSGWVPATVFNWSCTSDVGFGTGGVGDISAYAADNTGVGSVVNTVTVIPSAYGCTGAAAVFTVTVNPMPTISGISNYVYCNGDAGSAINFLNFSNFVVGSVFSWTSTSNVGFGTSGIGSVGSFIATNTSTAPITTTVTVTPSAGGCTGTPFTFTITVNPMPNVNAVSSRTHCSGDAGAPIPFSGLVPATVYNWAGTEDVGFGLSGAGDISAYTADNAGVGPVVNTVTVIPSAYGCTGAAALFTVTVNPTPTISGISDYVYCNGDIGTGINFLNFSNFVVGSVFSWTSSISIGFGTFGIGGIGTFTATNTGTTPITTTITVTPSAGGCTGTPFSFTITINPTPTVNTVSNRVHCAGDAAAPINFTGAVPGTTYGWTSSGDAGFGVSGTGSIAAYTASNASIDPVVNTITVIPSIGTCLGTATSFIVTVNPTPTISGIADIVLCNGAVYTGINFLNFSNFVVGSTFSWTSSISIGFGTFGIGGIGTFTAINTGTTPIVTTITVTPSAGGCTGAPYSFTITINPTPNVDSVSSAVYCSGDAVPGINFTGSVASTIFTWVGTADIGFGATNIGDIPPFTVLIPSASDVNDIITVTPEAKGCVGTPTTFTLTAQMCAAKPGGTSLVPEEEIYVYPTPSTGAFTLELPVSNTDAQVTVTDINGKVVSMKNVAAANHVNKVHFDLSNVIKGMYFISIANGNTVYNTKVMLK